MFRLFAISSVEIRRFAVTLYEMNHQQIVQNEVCPSMSKSMFKVCVSSFIHLNRQSDFSKCVTNAFYISTIFVLFRNSYISHIVNIHFSMPFSLKQNRNIDNFNRANFLFMWQLTMRSFQQYIICYPIIYFLASIAS